MLWANGPYCCCFYHQISFSFNKTQQDWTRKTFPYMKPVSHSSSSPKEPFHRHPTVFPVDTFISLEMIISITQYTLGKWDKALKHQWVANLLLYWFLSESIPPPTHTHTRTKIQPWSNLIHSQMLFLKIPFASLRTNVDRVFVSLGMPIPLDFNRNDNPPPRQP